METGNYNYKTILKTIVEAMELEDIKVFTTSRPNATRENLQSFVVVSLPITIHDLLAHGKTVIRFVLYARDVEGYENTTLLSELQELIYSKLPLTTEKYMVMHPVTLPGIPDSLGFHTLVIQSSLIII